MLCVLCQATASTEKRKTDIDVLSLAYLPSGYAILLGDAFFTRAPTVKLLPILVMFGAVPDVAMCVLACSRYSCDLQSLLDMTYQQPLARA